MAGLAQTADHGRASKNSGTTRDGQRQPILPAMPAMAVAVRAACMLIGL